MYKPEELIKENILQTIPITNEVKNLAEIFSRKMDLNYVSNRGMKLLKSAGCETIGDVYYFILDHRYDVGYKTAIDILFRIIEALLPCKSAGECEKAFLLARKEDKNIMKKWNVIVVASEEIEVEANTREEAEELAAEMSQFSAVDYCRCEEIENTEV